MTLRALISAACIALIATSASAQLAYVTFLNNSPDPALRSADLWVTQNGVESKVSGVDFQKADNLNSVAIFGDLEVTLSLAPFGSISAAEALVSHTFTPQSDRGYMAIASGVRAATGYVPNPDGKPVTLAITHFEVSTSVTDPNKSGVYFYNGATDLEASDVWLRGASKASASALKFLEHNSTVAVIERKASIIDFTKPNDKTKVTASFSVDFGALASSVVVCVVSGFKTPSDNNASTDTLSLLSVLDDGRVVRSALISGSQTSRVQLVHNSPDPTLATVDVWINGTKAFDNVAFRRATPFTPVPANTPIVVGIAPATSTQYRDTLFTISLEPLRPGRVNHLIAHGVVDSAKFERNPDGAPIDFGIAVYDGALEFSPEAGKTAVRSAHYIPDSRRVSFQSSVTTFASKLPYSGVTSTYTFVAPAIDTVWILDTADAKVRGYICDFRGTGKSVFMMSSGFMTPASNSNGPSYRLILVDASGTVNSSLVEVEPGPVSVLEEPLSLPWIAGPNPATDMVSVSIPGSFTNVRLEMVAMDGSIATSVTLVANTAQADGTLDVSRVLPGAYQLRVVDASGNVLAEKGLIVRR